jgi:NAD(P)-dependent dehydrogenase (short-subunit alcohol dehydrogenase family)
MGEFDGRTAIVTGGGGEIDSAVAVRLARDGARVLVVDLDREGVDRAVAQITKAGGEARDFTADVTDAAAVAAYAQAGAELGDGEIDLFVNNAGIEGPVAPIEEYPHDAFERVMSVNVRGVFLGLKHVLPLMPAVAPSSTLRAPRASSARRASSHTSRPSTPSSGSRRLPRSRWPSPGPVEGRMMTSLEDGLGGAAAHDAFLDALPLGRHAQLDEVAAMVAFLLSGEAGFSTGGRLCSTAVRRWAEARGARPARHRMSGARAGAQRRASLVRGRLRFRAFLPHRVVREVVMYDLAVKEVEVEDAEPALEHAHRGEQVPRVDGRARVHGH